MAALVQEKAKIALRKKIIYLNLSVTRQQHNITL